MFIVERRGLRLKKGFFVWSFLLLIGALALTIHVHYQATRARRVDGASV
jgi:hypothetical protein